ncbi:hypothetical protein SG34_013795 [Thalassomonas viridans]|uniref:Uncharacterized protein n=1 Tax=Thalassomonas viridans TaxID=137584 RepID=A0AAE9Z6W4_9GAMM|nr:hypothetical protein [Thalassomonas viridans]WDE07856.1 hypothetical protein SG34_013795 [Thalassomonas viridans]
MSEVKEVSEGRHMIYMSRQEAIETIQLLSSQLVGKHEGPIRLLTVSDDAPDTEL